MPKVEYEDVIPILIKESHETFDDGAVSYHTQVYSRMTTPQTQGVIEREFNPPWMGRPGGQFVNRAGYYHRENVTIISQRAGWDI